MSTRMTALFVIDCFAFVFLIVLVSANSFMDVDRGHWAYEALGVLADDGLLFPGTVDVLKTGQSITRVEMAMFVAEVLDHLRCSGDKYTAGGDTDSDKGGNEKVHVQGATPVDVGQLLRRANGQGGVSGEVANSVVSLCREFATELQGLGYRVLTSGISRAPGELQIGGDFPFNSVSGFAGPSFELQTMTISLDETQPGCDEGKSVRETGDMSCEQEGQAGQNVIPATLGDGWPDDREGLNEKSERQGDQPAPVTDEFQLYRRDGVKEIKSIIELGSIGSTVILARYRGTDEGSDDYQLTALDGTIYLAKQIRLGAKCVGSSWEEMDLGDDGIDMASIKSEISILPGVDVIGEFVRSNMQSGAAGAFRVGARYTSNSLVFDASFRSAEPGFTGVPGDDTGRGASSGYGLRLVLGNLLLSTDSLVEDVPDTDEEGGSRQVTRRMDFEYKVSELGTFRATYQYVDLDKLDCVDVGNPERAPEASTSLGFDVYIPRGLLKAGVEFKGKRATETDFEITQTTIAGVEYELPWNTRLLADFSLETDLDGSKKTTAVKLDYTVDDATSLLLGYKLVDVASLKDSLPEGCSRERRNLATAEISLQF